MVIILGSQPATAMEEKLKILMKRMQFVDDHNSYVRKFTRIDFIDDKIYISHTFNKPKQEIQFDDIDLWVNYFDRL